MVYWLQQPGGTVYKRTPDGYEALKLEGTPSLFKERATIAVGQPVDIMFNDQPAGPPTSVTVMRDENGKPSMALVRHGNAISFSVLNVGTPFRARASVSLKGTNQDTPGGLLATDCMTAVLSDNKSAVTIHLLTGAKPATQGEQFGAIFPGVVQYTTDILFRDLWLRPGLAPRDRSLVTVSSLIASGQVAQLTGHLNIGMNNGLTQTEIAEAITHLTFYVGWPNVFSAMPVAKDVFDKRPRGRAPRAI